MPNVIEKGSFVLYEAHPEYGIGKVIAMEAFSSRVLFPEGGLRLFRSEDMTRLKNVSQPPQDAVALLASREAELARGVLPQMIPKNPPAPVAPPKKRAPRKKKAASNDDE
jgi:hypothetical protein